MGIEDLLMQIQSYLCQLKVEDLGEIAKTLGSGDSDIKDKNRKGLVRWIEEHLEAELKGSAEEKSEYLEDFKVGIMNYTPHCPLLEDASKKTKPEASQSELAKVKLEYEAVKQKLEALTARNLHSPVKEVESKEDVKTKGESKPLFFQPSDFKRELKIIGQIGEPGQKDKLSFVSLVRQIEGALQKGYKSQEVVDAVVRAINPGMRLRSYLEGLSDLALPRLRRILRSHYQEKSATDLYRQLSTLVQEPQENPQSFLIRALDTRQKILFASQEVNVQLKYDPKLVQGMFLHAIDTGLQDEAIRTRLRPILERPDVQDEDLIQQMNVVMSEETERKSKLGSTPRQKNSRVNEVHATQGEGGPAQSGITAKKMNPPRKDSPKEEQFMAALQAVRSELATLKESVERNRSNEERFNSGPPINQNQQWYQGPRGCISCQKEGRGELCNHCHICGGSDHWARGCRKRNTSYDKASSGNRRGLQPRDRK